MNKTRLTTRLTKSLKEFHNEHLNLQKQLRRAGLKLSTNETWLASSVAKQIAAEIDREILQDLQKVISMVRSKSSNIPMLSCQSQTFRVQTKSGLVILKTFKMKYRQVGLSTFLKELGSAEN